MGERILVCDPFHGDGLKILRQSGLKVDYRPEISYTELLRIVKDYDCLIVRSRTRITADVIENARKLRLITRAGSGLENIDLEAVKRRGIRVVRCPEAVATPVAELTIALIIILARKLDKAINALRRGIWMKNELTGLELYGKTLGVIGVGSVGGKVAEIASGMGMKLLLNDVRPLDTAIYGDCEQVRLEALLRNSDFVTIHVPLNETTHGMIDEEKLRLMKPTAYLINTSRPELVDPKALYKSIRDGWIAGAAMEVTEEWLRKRGDLVKLDKLILTPHIGAQTKEARMRASIEVAKLVVKELSAL